MFSAAKKSGDFGIWAAVAAIALYAATGSAMVSRALFEQAASAHVQDATVQLVAQR